MTLFIAGDANRDTKVDGTDSALIEAALGAVTGGATYSTAFDVNQDGRIDTTDLHLYRQNLGFIPNQAPVATNATAKTHQDLELLFPMDASRDTNDASRVVISDQENDPIVYRIVGATNGTARMASDGTPRGVGDAGTSVSFTPTTGFFGEASFSIVGDDGYAVSQQRKMGQA